MQNARNRAPKSFSEKANFRVCQGESFVLTKTKESYESKVLKQKQDCVAVAVTAVVS